MGHQFPFILGQFSTSMIMGKRVKGLAVQGIRDELLRLAKGRAVQGSNVHSKILRLPPISLPNIIHSRPWILYFICARV